jgi:UDP-N-acetylglucosamine--N-acetylmuramyl-(pentapeptide) pyrophosphoryl-undecaprenol N-acetylglucosamine transferase
VRRTVIQAAQERDRKRCKGPDARRSRAILVVGGSQGARAINRAVCDALPELEDWRGKLRWLHVAGPDDRAEVEAVYRAGGWDAAVWGYCQELPRLMAESDLVIARAGGTTLAEIAVLGLPALLVPYAHHRDGHQVLNAKLLADAGAAQLVPQSDLDPEAIRAWIARVLFDPARVEAMRAASLALAKPGAADAVLNLLLECRHPCPSLSVSSS